MKKEKRANKERWKDKKDSKQEGGLPARTLNSLTCF